MASTRFIVVPASAATPAAGRADRATRWVYLGTDLGQRARWAATLGVETALQLGDRLHVVMERLRQPFLDFIATLGAAQPDVEGWWASALSWKVCGASDLFLLASYAHVVDVLRSESSGSLLLIVVEDPWLYRQLQSTHASTPGVVFAGGVRLWPARVRAATLGAAKRAVWAGRLLRSRVVQRWHSGRHEPPPGADVAIYSFPLDRYFRGAADCMDPFLGEIDRILERAGYTIERFSPPDAVGFEKAVGARRRFFSPLVLELRLRMLVVALFRCWRPCWPKSSAIEGVPVDWLLRREWWRDLAGARFFLTAVFLQCMRGFLNRRAIRLIVYPYENQPWEKMIVLAARERGAKVLGYQHGGGMPHLMLSYFHGAGEADAEPLPDLILTSGRHAHRVLADGGTPPSRLVLGGSWRFPALAEDASRVELDAHDEDFFSRILVALPLTTVLFEHLLAAIVYAFPDGGRAEGLQLVFKPHPGLPLRLERLPFRAEIVAGTFREAMARCATVLYTASSVGMEALIAGRRVLRYRSDLFVNMDHGDAVPEAELPTCDDRSLRQAVLDTVRTLRRERRLRGHHGDLLGGVFAPIDEARWLQAIRELAPVAEMPVVAEASHAYAH